MHLSSSGILPGRSRVSVVRFCFPFGTRSFVFPFPEAPSLAFRVPLASRTRLSERAAPHVGCELDRFQIVKDQETGTAWRVAHW